MLRNKKKIVAKQPIEILNPYEWLPSYGESGLTLTSNGCSLKVTISYDSESSDEEVQKILEFGGVCDYHFYSVPGVNLMKIEYDESSLGQLIKYRESYGAKMWNKHYGENDIEHYQIFFLAENKCLDIFAESWGLSDKI